MADILISMNKTTDKLWKYADEWEKTPEHFDGVNPFCVAIHAVRQTTNAPELPNGDQRWISVKDRLPDDASDVLAYYDDGTERRTIPANYYKRCWYDCVFNRPISDLETGFIKYWMPSPKPPEGVK